MSKVSTIDGAEVSTACLGCMQFGGTADIAASREMFEACRLARINFFDTAHTYTGGSSRQNITRQFDESRQRLKMDAIDILYLHRWDPNTALEETFETLAQFQQAGTIRYIGVSNFSAWQVMKAQAVARSFGTGIDILQPMYSLVKRQSEVEIFPMAISEEFAVACYSPLAAGLLTGKYQSGGTGRLSSDPRYAQRYSQAWMHQTAADFVALAAEMGFDPTTLAVAWAAHHPAVTTPIISARSVAQIMPSLAAAATTLDAEAYARIAALSLRPAPATDRLEEASA